MRYPVAIAIALFVMVLAVAVPFAGSQNAAGAPVDVTVSGRVVTGFDLDGLKDVDVFIDNTWHGTTNKDGEFTIVISKEVGDKFTIRFELKGYLVKAFFYNGDLLGWNEKYIIDVTGTAVVLQDVVMDYAFGTIEGTATLNGRPISGVTVEVSDPDSGERTMKATNWDGSYSFTLPVGVVYNVSINSPYYMADSVDVSVDGIEPVVCNFKLEQKAGATYLFGLDFTHSMMLVGGILGLFLFIFVISYRIHISKHPESSKIHSDTKKKDQD